MGTVLENWRIATKNSALFIAFVVSATMCFILIAFHIEMCFILIVLYIYYELYIDYVLYIDYCVLCALNLIIDLCALY